MANQSRNNTSSYLLIEWTGSSFPSEFPQPYLISTDNIANVVHHNNGTGGGGLDAIRINYFTRHTGGALPMVELEWTGGLSLNDATATINSLISAIIGSQQEAGIGTRWDANANTSVLGNTLASITVTP